MSKEISRSSVNMVRSAVDTALQENTALTAEEALNLDTCKQFTPGFIMTPGGEEHYSAHLIVSQQFKFARKHGALTV